ncbi:hypothetical protein Tco_0542751 [Tanacetum coccineum]
MITTTSRIEDKNLLGLILPKDTMETFLCVTKNAPGNTQEIARFKCPNMSRKKKQKGVFGDKVGPMLTENCRDKRSPLENNTLEDIQVHQNLLQSENSDHQATIFVICYFYPTTRYAT